MHRVKHTADDDHTNMNEGTTGSTRKIRITKGSKLKRQVVLSSSEIVEMIIRCVDLGA